MATISYRFTAVGVDAVKKSFESIDAAAKRSLASTQRAFYNQQQWQERAAKRSAEITSQAFAGSMDKIKAEQAKSTEQWKSYFSRIKDMAKGAKTSVRDSLGGAANAPKPGSPGPGAKGGGGMGAVAMGLVGGAAAAVGYAAISAGQTAARNAITQALDVETRSAQVSALTSVGGKAAIDKSIIANTVKQAVFSVQGADLSSGFDTIASLMDRLGDFDEAVKMLPQVLRAQAAYGAAPGDTAKMLAGMKQAGLSGQTLIDATATIMEQGKTGSIPFEEFANKFGKLLGAGKNIGLGGVSGTAQIGGVYQAIAPFMGSAEEAITGLATMMDLMARRSSSEMGVSLTDSSGKQENLVTLMLANAVAAYDKAGGKGNEAAAREKLALVYGDQGGKALAAVFNRLKEVTGETFPTLDQLKAAVPKVREEMEKLTGVMSNEAKLKTDAAIATNTASAAWITGAQKMNDDFNSGFKISADEVKAALDLIKPMVWALGGILSGTVKALGWLAHPIANAKKDIADARALTDKINTNAITEKPYEIPAGFVNMTGENGEPISAVFSDAQITALAEAYRLAQDRKESDKPGNVLGALQ
jgi:hypothetical protein